MSDSESDDNKNFFSETDSEKEDENKTIEELYPEDEEEDYEINKIINDHINNIDIDDDKNSYDTVRVEKKVRQRKVKENTKKIINIEVNDFSVNKKEEKKSKWKSKRMHDKKKENGTLKNNKVVRKFHPKLPSPLYLKINGFNNYSKKVNLNNKNFPELK